MNILQAIDKQIDSSQSKYWEGVQWLVQNGMLGSGRTHLLALAFIQQALYASYPVHVWDHFQPENRRSVRYLLREIDKCVHYINQDVEEDMELRVIEPDMIQIIVHSTKQQQLDKF